MEEFYTQLEEGHYFWWRLVPNRSGSTVTIPDMSRAFNETHLMEAALTRLRSTPNVLAVDVDDTAGEDWSEDIKDIDEDDLPLDVDDPGASSIPVAVDAYMSEEHDAVTEDVEMSPGVIDATIEDVPMAPSAPEPILPTIKGLELPTQMATFGFGILTLLGFPGDPNMPVCYRCGVVIFSHNVTSFRSHECRSSQPESTIQVDTPEEEEAVDVVMTIAENGEDRYNVEEEEDDSGREDEIADEQPISHTRTRWAPLTTYLKNNRDKFSTKLATQWPPKPIPAISVLPVQKGYACPVSTCPHAYVKSERLRRHMTDCHQDFPEVEDNEDFAWSGDSPIQSLRHVSAKPAYFKVIVDQTEPAPASLSERMLKALTIADGRDKARTINNAPLMEGPQHTNIFLKTFRYQSIFPADVSEYTSFAISRVKHASPVYSPSRSPQSQLLTLSFLVYMLQGRDALIHTDDTIRRHIGNKDLYDNLASAARSPSYRPLSTDASVIRYSCTFSQFINYMLSVIPDASVDPDLYICNEQRVAGNALLKVLQEQVTDDDVQEKLKYVVRINQERVLVPPPAYFKHTGLSAILPTCLLLQEPLHAFIYTLVCHPRESVNNSNALTAPINRFLAIAAWTPDLNPESSTGHFKGPSDLTGLITQILYCFRMAIFTEYRRQHALKPDDTLRMALQALHDANLCQDGLTPFGSAYSQRRYLSVMVKTIIGAPKTTWRDVGRLVSYNNLEVSLSQWRGMIQGIVDHATKLLNARILFDARATLFGGSGEYHRPNGVRDNVDERRAGYSFVDEHQFFYGKATALMDLVVATPELQARFLIGVTPDGDLRWNLSEIASWLTDVDEFVILLAILFYFLGGQPPRGPELLSHRMQNTPFAMRNLYCIQNRLVSSLEYTKSQNMTGTSLPVARIMARVVQELAEVYIIMVRPFQNALNGLLNANPESPFSNYTALLFTREGRPMTATQFSHYLREQSRKYIKHDWGIRVWRQIIITFSQALLPKEIQVMTVATTVLAQQASHRQSASDTNYNIQSDASLSGINTVRFMQFFMASTAYHEMLGFHHPDRTSSDYSLASTSNPGIDLRDHTNAVITGVVSGVADLLKEAKRQQDLSEAVNSSDRHVDPFPNFIPLHNIQVAATTLAFLRRLYPGGHFRTKEQAQAVQYVLEYHREPLLVIQPLASGKSTLFHVAAIAENSIMGVSVVLVPLVSLAQATVDAARKKGIAAHHVTPLETQGNNIPFPNIQIVVMTYDLFLESRMMHLWVRAKIEEKVVRRIVVDEVHMVVTDVNFRTSFRTMFETLSRFNVGLVLLTGTLSIAHAEELRSTMNMFPVIRISRLSTERTNLSYRVCQKLGASDETVNAFCALVRSVLIPKLETNKHTRAIIYTYSVKWAEEIGDKLGIPVYTQLADKQAKKKALDAWLDVNDKETLSHCFAATTSLSMGLHHPHCYDVWFFGDAYSIVLLAQMAARAGRDNKRAVVRVFPLAKGLHSSSESELGDFRSTRGCRRVPMSSQLDGYSVTCSGLPNAELCDNCEPLGTIDEVDAYFSQPSAASTVSQGTPPFQGMQQIVQGMDNPPPDQSSSVFPPESIDQVYTAGAVTTQRDIRLTEVALALLESTTWLHASCCACLLAGRPLDHDKGACPYPTVISEDQLRKIITNVRTKVAHGSNFVACRDCYMPQNRKILHAMDAHLHSIADDGDRCLHAEQGIRAVLSLLSAPKHRSKLARISHNPTNLLTVLFTPFTLPPCSHLDPDRQLLHLHFVLAAALSECSGASKRLVDLAAEAWFRPWLVPDAPLSDTAIISEMDLVPRVRMIEADERTQQDAANIRRIMESVDQVMSI